MTPDTEVERTASACASIVLHQIEADGYRPGPGNSMELWNGIRALVYGTLIFKKGYK
jgi:hypothetical protein